MGILEAGDKAAFLIDQYRRVGPPDGFPEAGNKSLQLIGRIAIIAEQDQAERIGLSEKPDFLIG
jgi:hypothetical protein